MSAEPRLEPSRHAKVPRTGAVGSVQAAEIDIRAPVVRVMSHAFLESAAAEYWRVITRFTLGLVRVSADVHDQCVVLIARPFVLLRFHAPEYETGVSRASITWRIKRGILVSRSGRDRGFLRLVVEPLGQAQANAHHRVRVQMEVRNFYPWLRGSGTFARIGVWLYAQTQQRIHRTVTRRFLKKLAASAAG